MEQDSTNHLVGFFNVKGMPETQSVETQLTGKARSDYEHLWVAIRKKFPKAKKEDITRTGSAIEKRDVAPRKVEYPAGATLKQLFNTEQAGADGGCSITVGTVILHGQSCEVLLRYHRAKNIVGVTLRERSTRVPIRFSDPIKGMRLVREAREIIKGVLGNGATALVLDLVEVSPATK